MGELETRITPDGTIVAASYSTGAIYKINAETGDVRETMVGIPDATVGAGGLTTGPDGNFYISDQLGDTIYRYVVATDTLEPFIDSLVLTPIGTGFGAPSFFPSSLRFGPDGNLYVSMNGSQAAGPGTGRIVRFDINNGIMGLEYAGSNVAFGTGLIQPLGITFGTAPGDENSLYVCNLFHLGGSNFVGQVSKIPSATTATPATAATAFIAPNSNGLEYATGLAWAPDGDLLVVDLGAGSGVGKVMKFNPDGTPESTAGGILATAGLDNEQYPADIVQDDQDHYFVSTLGSNFETGPAFTGSILRYNLDGSNVQQFFVTSADIPDSAPGITGFTPGQMVFIPNQAPLLNLLSTGPVFTEDGPAVFIDSFATIEDEDSPNFLDGELSITIANGGSVDDRIIIQGDGLNDIEISGSEVSYQGTVIGTFIGGDGTDPLVVDLTVAATVEATQALLRNLTFSNVSNNPSTDFRTLEVTLTDGDTGTSNTATVFVSVNESNDAPVIATNTSLTVLEGGSGTIAKANLETTDADTAAIMITYSVTVAPARGTLLLSNAPTFSFTQADINANLVTYVNDGNEFTSDSFQFVVSDGFPTPIAGTFNIIITPVNDTPTASPNMGLTVLEGGSGAINSTILGASDPDNVAADLTFTVVTSPARGTLKIGGSPVTTFTQTDLIAGLLSYVNDGSDYTSDSFKFTISDGSATSASATFNITITPVNDLPTLTRNQLLNVIKGSSTVLANADLVTTDPDNTSSQLSYTVTVVPAHGTLQINGMAVTSFSQADIDTGRVSYVHDNSVFTTDSFSFTVTDGIETLPVAVFSIAIHSIPTITDDPDAAEAFAGTLVTLTAAATGSPSPSVQWQVKPSALLPFENIAGATSTTYSFVLKPSQTGSEYRAVFTNIAGSTPTAAAAITVKSGLAILTSPLSQTVPVGKNVTFSAEAVGTTKTTVQWQVSSDDGVSYTNIAGATKSTFTVKKASVAQDGNLYRAVFKNAAGIAESVAAELTVNFTVSLVGNQTITVTPGTDVTLVAQAKSSPATFQWQFSTDKGKTWTNAVGLSTEATYLIDGPLLANSGHKFRALITIGTKTTNSPSATLTVIAPPTAPTAPTTTTPSVSAGATVTFTTTPPVEPVKTTIQWQVSTDGGKTFTTIKGQTKATLTLKNLKTTQTGLYRAVFTNVVGQSFSINASLTVT